MPTSSQNTNNFRRSLEGAAEVAISEHTDSITSSVVAAIWNAVDDELGRLQEQIDRQRQTIDNAAAITAKRDAELAARPTRAEVLRRAADSVEQTFMVGVTPATERNKVWDEAVRAVSTELRRMATTAERGEQS